MLPSHALARQHSCRALRSALRPRLCSHAGAERPPDASRLLGWAARPRVCAHLRRTDFRQHRAPSLYAMKLKALIAQYVAFRNSLGARFESSEGRLNAFCLWMGEEINVNRCPGRASECLPRRHRLPHPQPLPEVTAQTVARPLDGVLATPDASTHATRRDCMHGTARAVDRL